MNKHCMLVVTCNLSLLPETVLKSYIITKTFPAGKLLLHCLFLLSLPSNRLEGDFLGQCWCPVTATGLTLGLISTVSYMNSCSS